VLFRTKSEFGLLQNQDETNPDFNNLGIGVKIYTKTGDGGTTGLFGGGRVSKSSPRIAAYGDIDELNSWLGLVRAETPHQQLKSALTEIQATLFVLGSQLASPQAKVKMEVVTAAHVDWLERQIDVMETSLQPMRNFILPGGSRTAALLHLARTVCRRAERAAVSLAAMDNEPVDRWVLIYINRLSDYLFVMARLANQLERIEDIPWKGRTSVRDDAGGDSKGSD
jgi:cob(I)alamin adenosyltransferase